MPVAHRFYHSRPFEQYQPDILRLARIPARKTLQRYKHFPASGDNLGESGKECYSSSPKDFLITSKGEEKESLLFIPRIVNRPCKSIRERLLFANFRVWEPSVRTIHTHERATEGMIFRPIRILDSIQTAYGQHTGSTLQLLSVPKTSRLAYQRATCMLSRMSERPLSGIFPKPECQIQTLSCFVENNYILELINDLLHAFECLGEK